MNPKSRVRVYHENGKIEMNKIFAKMAENPFTEEYAFLQKLRGDYPAYTVTVREIKKNTTQEHYAGLTYGYMKAYIKSHGSEKERAEHLAIFEEMELISKCHSKGKRYPAIKSWFLETYPEVAKFGCAADSKSTEENVPNNVINYTPPAEETATAELKEAVGQ